MQLSGEGRMSGRYVTIARYDNVPLAELARLRLEDAGIPVHVENAELVTALWHYGTAFGNVQLNVPEEHAAAALELIEELQQSGLPTNAPESPEGKPLCLACGAEFPGDAEQCPACGWSFGTAESTDSNDTSTGADDTGVAAAVEPAEAAGRPILTEFRSVGRPLLSIWVGLTLGMMLLGVLSCVLSMLNDLFR